MSLACESVPASAPAGDRDSPFSNTHLLGNIGTTQRGTESHRRQPSFQTDEALEESTCVHHRLTIRVLHALAPNVGFVPPNGGNVPLVVRRHLFFGERLDDRDSVPGVLA
jgi:hypothetical protein